MPTSFGSICTPYPIVKAIGQLLLKNQINQLQPTLKTRAMSVTSRPGSTTSWARSTTVARYCSLWAYHFLTWVIHTESVLASFSLNFEVLMELEANELLKGLVLGKDKNIHLRITPLSDVGCYNPPP
ncbi:hypothetical protein DVH24_011995 [Malus domestica]|uniref:Uncharacterized protein n=1 Tax=Malus domestica TaxID=3750 RepID=A0A498JHS5_MALDO|nr:hypothetical protein DVH24_011995 [Malus domestica]